LSSSDSGCPIPPDAPRTATFFLPAAVDMARAAEVAAAAAALAVALENISRLECWEIVLLQ
jgi:hypothetical protein